MKSAKAVRSKNVSRQSIPPAAPEGWQTWHLLAGFAVTVLAALWCYEPALRGAFVFDDIYLPFQWPQAASRKLIEWLTPVRPLLMLSFWFNYRISGTDPFGYHLTNVLLHACNTCFAFLIFRRLLAWQNVAERRRSILAAFGAGLFLLHPLQTESVAYVASRSEVLSVGFLLAAYAVFLYRPAPSIGWPHALAVLALFGLAAMSKEHAVVLPAVLLLTDYYWNPGWSLAGIRRNWRLYIPVAAGAGLAMVVVFKVLSQATTAGFGMKDLKWYEYFFTQCRVIWSYLRLFVVPYPLNVDPDVAIARSPAEPGAAIGLLALAGLVAAAWIYRKRYPLASFGVFAMLLMLAPTSSVAPLRDPMAEHRMYLPFFALTLVPLEGLLRWRDAGQTKLALALSAVLLAMAFLTYQRNSVWQDPIALWQDSAAKSPRKARPHFQLAYALFTAGRHSEAVSEYEKAAALETPDVRLLVDWALAADAAGRPEEARQRLRQALEMEKTAHVWSTLGMVEAKQGRRQEALAALDAAEKADPNFEMTYFYRGNLLLQGGDAAGAIAQYQRALALNPANAPAQQMLREAQRRALR